MEEERTRFMFNGEYYTGEIKMVTPEPEPVKEEPEPEPVVIEANPEPEPVKEEPTPEPEPVVEPTPEPEPVKEEPTPEPVVEIKRNKNELGVNKTTITHLSKFDIRRARVYPHKSATIDIVIYTNDKEVERTVSLAGEDYLKWSSDDDYLYDYVRANIDKIYDN